MTLSVLYGLYFSPRLVDHDFRVQIEVYCSVHTEPHPPVTPTSGSTTSHSGKTSTPIKVLRKIKKVREINGGGIMRH